MILSAKEKTSYEFSVQMPIFTPYYNQCNMNVYWQDKPFRHDPFTILAQSTSGSPFIIAGNKFFGFLNRSGGQFAYDGQKLTVTLEAGQELLVDEQCDPWSMAKEYTHMILGDEDRKEEKFWSELEYCTWVEQTKVAYFSGSTNGRVLNEAFVRDYLKKIEDMRLPVMGKFTIDDGWAVGVKNGEYLLGEWEINRAKFPNFEKLIEDIAALGYKPGLWFSPFNVTHNSKFAIAHPELVCTSRATGRGYEIHYTPNGEDVIREYYRNLFKQYIDMGIKKLKIDISYGRKNEMIDLFRILSEEVKKMDATVEIEGHIPDVFASRYADTVRLNDVSIYPHENWQYTTEGHFDVCRYSCDRILNLDHLGGNNPQCDANLFIEHCNQLLRYSKITKSYPVVSMIPDFYAGNIQDKFRGIINEFVAE